MSNYSIVIISVMLKLNTGCNARVFSEVQVKI
jgi:hypothetical protein